MVSREMEVVLKEEKYQKFKKNKEILMKNLRILSGQIRSEMEYTKNYYSKLSEAAEDGVELVLEERNNENVIFS